MRPHAHALKQGRATPPSVRATRRHGGGRTQARNRAHKRLFDTARRMSRQRQKNTTRGHTRRHSATEGRRATGATTKRHRRTTSPAKNRPGRPPKPSDARRTPRGRHTDTTRTRPHITNGGGYARTRAQRVQLYRNFIYILLYFILYASLYILFVFYIIAFFFLLFIQCFSLHFSACALCARVILPRICIFIQYLCIFIYKVSIYRYFMQFLYSRDCLALIYYIYITRDTLTP